MLNTFVHATTSTEVYMHKRVKINGGVVGILYSYGNNLHSQRPGYETRCETIHPIQSIKGISEARKQVSICV